MFCLISKLNMEIYIIMCYRYSVKIYNGIKSVSNRNGNRNIFSERSVFLLKINFFCINFSIVFQPPIIQINHFQIFKMYKVQVTSCSTFKISIQWSIYIFNSIRLCLCFPNAFFLLALKKGYFKTNQHKTYVC